MNRFWLAVAALTAIYLRRAVERVARHCCAMTADIRSGIHAMLQGRGTRSARKLARGSGERRSVSATWTRACL